MRFCAKTHKEVEAGILSIMRIKLEKLTAYQLFGWTPLLITVAAASVVAGFGIKAGL